MAVQEIVEQTVTGLGYDLVEIERSAGGLLRITIDLPWAGAGSVAQFVNVEDCEKVTRQLQFALEVDAVEYKRLEVSSPGIDRPLRHEKDFERFAGQVIDITLKVPIGGNAGVKGSESGANAVNANRKKFRGTLENAAQQADNAAAAGGAQWQIVWSDGPAAKPGQRVSKKKAPAALQAMRFELGELKEARLAPIVSFKGRAS